MCKFSILKNSMMKVSVVILLLSMVAASMAQYGRGGYHDGGHHDGGHRQHSSSSSSSSSSSGSKSCENGGGGEGEGFECNKCSNIDLFPGSSPDVLPTSDSELFDKNGCQIEEVKCDFSGQTTPKGYMIFNDDFATLVNPNMAEQVIQQRLTCSKSGDWSFQNAAGKEVIVKKVACKAAVCDTCSVKNKNLASAFKQTVELSGLNEKLCRTGTITCAHTSSVQKGTIKFSAAGSPFECGKECNFANPSVVHFTCNTDPAKVVVIKADGSEFAADTADCDPTRP